MNEKQLSDAVDAAFREAVMITANEVTKVISENRLWSGFGDIRDIVDTGQLRASQEIKFSEVGEEIRAEIIYNTEYAAAVHNGATIRYANGTTRRIIPRPFIEEGVKRKPPLETMQQLLPR